jgi:hypothetical protein
MIKKYWPVIALLGLVAFFLFKKKSDNPITIATSNSAANKSALQLETTGGSSAISYQGNADINRIPNAGYSGPANGPFLWAGEGEPPNGNYVDIGISV